MGDINLTGHVKGQSKSCVYGKDACPIPPKDADRQFLLSDIIPNSFRIGAGNPFTGSTSYGVAYGILPTVTTGSG
jgi:hypothetical protein